MGSSTASSFIKPASGAFSAFNNTGSSAFNGGGNNTTSATNAAGGGGFSAFASQPSAFSLAAQTTPTTGSVFGQPSFGQPVPGPSVATTTSVFGNPPPAPTSVFGAPAFGTLSQQQAQPAQQQQQTTPASAFGISTTPSAFNTNASNPVFGQSPFGNTPQPTSAFASGPVTSSVFNNSNTNNSTFTPTAPSISVDMQSGVSSATTSSASTRTKSIYKPGSTPYDQQIPPNYKEALPKSVVQAFESQKFEWGDVPEWVPPVEVR